MGVSSCDCAATSLYLPTLLLGHLGAPDPKSSMSDAGAGFTKMDYRDTFAGLVSAVVDAGVGPEASLQFEAPGVHGISAAMCAFNLCQLPAKLLTSFKAVLMLSMRPDGARSTARPAPVQEAWVVVMWRLPIEGAGVGCATPDRFPRDVWAPSNQKPQDLRYVERCCSAPNRGQRYPNIARMLRRLQYTQ